MSISLWMLKWKYLLRVLCFIFIFLYPFVIVSPCIVTSFALIIHHYDTGCVTWGRLSWVNLMNKYYSYSACPDESSSLEWEFFHLSSLCNSIIMIKVTRALNWQKISFKSLFSKKLTYFSVSWKQCPYHSSLQLLLLSYNSLNNLITHHLIINSFRGPYLQRSETLSQYVCTCI